MSYSTPQRFGDEACSPGACGSGVWASRDPQAAKGGQAATTTPTPGRQPATTHANRTKPNFALPGRLAWWTDAADRNAIDSHPATRSAETAAEVGPAEHTPGTALPTEFRDCDGPVHKDTAGSPSQSRNHLHPTRGSHHDGLPTQRFITRSRCR